MTSWKIWGPDVEQGSLTWVVINIGEKPDPQVTLAISRIHDNCYGGFCCCFSVLFLCFGVLFCLFWFFFCLFGVVLVLFFPCTESKHMLSIWVTFISDWGKQQNTEEQKWSLPMPHGIHLAEQNGGCERSPATNVAWGTSGEIVALSLRVTNHMIMLKHNII